MPEKSTTPDLPELTRRAIEAAGRCDFDAAMAFYAADSVWDGSAMGIGVYKGVATIRHELEAWTAAFEDFEIEIEEISDMGNGVVLSLTSQSGRPGGVSGDVQMPVIGVTQWSDGKIVRTSFFMDADEARAAAERLAEERE
jgi:ketosteroid isomerase-like protein